MAELSSNRTDGNGVQVTCKTEIKKITVMCSRSPQNFEFGYFTLLFGRARWRNVPKFIKHVQGLCFPYHILLVGFTLQTKLVSSKHLIQVHLKISSRTLENLASHLVTK